MSPFRSVEIGTEEWDCIWASLADEINWERGSGSDSAPCTECHPTSKECWQYMGSHVERDWHGEHWVHDFRHRERPGTGRSESVRIRLDPRYFQGPS